MFEAFAEGQAAKQIAVKHSFSPVTISLWKKEYMEWALEIFKKEPIYTEKALTLSQEYISELE